MPMLAWSLAATPASVGCAFAGQLPAQNVPSDPAATGGQTNAAGTNATEQVVITGTVIEDNILPTNLPFRDAHGFDVPV